MPPISENPFAVLTAVVAPAILTNACSVLCLGTGNRLARVVDRTRAILAELSSLESNVAEYQIRVNQLERLQVRSQFLLRALRRFYASLGSFATAAVMSVIGSVLAFYDQQLGFHAAAIIGLAAGIFAVGSLVWGCIVMVRETRLAVHNLTEDAELARERFFPGKK
jgi:Protein of unknown function (DUF2721)